MSGMSALPPKADVQQPCSRRSALPTRCIDPTRELDFWVAHGVTARRERTASRTPQRGDVALPPKADIGRAKRMSAKCQKRTSSWFSANDALQNAKCINRPVGFTFFKVLLRHCHRVRYVRETYNLFALGTGDCVERSGLHFDG